MINLHDTWNGETLSDVRAFIQTLLKKGFVSVSQMTSGGNNILTFTKADGTTETIQFAAAEGSETDGYNSNFYLRKQQSVYGAGSSIAFTYTFTQTLDGEEVIGIVPNITFKVSTYDSSTGAAGKQLYTTASSAIGTNTITIPASAIAGVQGNVLIQGTAKTVYGGQEYIINKSMILTIAVCEIKFGNGFRLANQVKGYDTKGQLNDVFIDYTGTNNADILVYIDGIHRNTVSAQSGETVDIVYAMNSTDDSGEAILTNGIHTMQLVAKMDTGVYDDSDEPLYVYSNSLLFDFYKGITGKHVGIQLTLDSSEIIEDPVSNLTISTEQYTATKIPYTASSYNSSTSSYDEATAVSVSKDNVIKTNLAVPIDDIFNYIDRELTTTPYTLKFAVTANARTIKVNVIKNAAGISVASGASIDIAATGRSNVESVKTINEWNFSDNKGLMYKGTLSNFAFKQIDDQTIDGWDGEGLVFRGNTRLDLPYAPFSSFNTSAGYCIEFNFKVSTVLDSDAYILKCLNTDNVGGFYIKPEEVGMITLTGSTVTTPIAAGNKYNVTFMIKQYTGTNNGQTIKTTLLEMFVNGVRSGVIVFNEGDGFDSTATITANGMGAIWSLYGMRVYNTTLNTSGIYNNYLTTLTDPDEIIRLAEENDILNSSKTAVSYEKLLQKGKNVLIIEVGDGEEQCALDSSDNLGKLLDECTGSPLETRVIATKDQFLNPSAVKKDNFLVKSLTYYNNGTLSDAYSFKTGPSLLQVQGTSSTYYSRKNYDIFFTGLKYNKNDGSTKNWTSEFDTNVGTSVTDANTTSPKYAMSASDQPVPCLCLKADYSDSSNLHNTVLTKLVNDVWMNLGSDYQTPPQHNNDTEYDKVRVGINGHPIDVFVKDGTNYEYIGQYNMNNEKKDSHHVFGFTAGSGNPSVGEAICIEFLENNRTATLFNAGKDFDWDTCSDTVDEEAKGIPQLEFRYPGYDWDEAPNELKIKAKRPFVWVKECYDDWVNSYNDITGEYTSSKFVEELTKYFNPKNLVSWYLFTEYFMAVDQRSKNMMMASWDATATSGIWYFLPYDSDTALGVTNDGWLILPWDADENTPNPKDPTQYAFMGHDSNLWKLVRFFLYDDTYTSIERYGLKGCSMQEIAQTLRNESVNNVLFNTNTIDKSISASRDYWSDIIYNFDADTKYIKPLTYQTGRGSKSDFAQFIQGARDAHRDWLINKRFKMLDSKYAAGHFITDEKNMKVSKEAGVEAGMIVTSPTTAYVQLIINTRVVSEQKLSAGESKILSIDEFAVGSNDPFKLQGFSAVDSIDFNTISPYIYSDVAFPATFTNLKKLVMNCQNNDGILKENISNIVLNLPNLRELTIKGYPNATGILNLSNNIMLEHVDIACDKLSNIILPYNYFNLKYANFGHLNNTLPWEFWDKLNDYYATQGKSLFVGELTTDDAIYKMYAARNPQSSGNMYQIRDRYFVYVYPHKSLPVSCYTYSGSSDQVYTFGAKSSYTERTLQEASYLKGIIYAKLDITMQEVSLEYTSGTQDCFINCSNLEYVNTQGWNARYYQTYTWNMRSMVGLSGCNKLHSIDLSYIDNGIYSSNGIAPGCTKNSDWPGNNSSSETQCALEYVRYGAKYFDLFITNNNYTIAPEYGQPDYSNMLCKLPTLNAQTYIDLAEDLPNIKGITVVSNALSVGSAAYNDYNKFPNAVRTKIENKGWTILG